MTYVNDTGLCSVTQCFSPYIDWSHISPSVLEKAADRGNRVHRALADEANGEFVIVDDDIKGYVEAGRKFLAMAAEILMVEQRLISDLYKFTGQVDLVCQMRGETDISLVDFKTSSVVSKSWGLQLSAYKNLVDANNYQYNIKRLMSVRLKKDGNYAIHEYTNPAYLFSVFLNALSTFRFFYDNPSKNINWEAL